MRDTWTLGVQGLGRRLSQSTINTSTIFFNNFHLKKYTLIHHRLESQNGDLLILQTDVAVI